MSTSFESVRDRTCCLLAFWLCCLWLTGCFPISHLLSGQVDRIEEDWVVLTRQVEGGAYYSWDIPLGVLPDVQEGDVIWSGFVIPGAREILRSRVEELQRRLFQRREPLISQAGESQSIVSEGSEVLPPSWENKGR